MDLIQIAAHIIEIHSDQGTRTLVNYLLPLVEQAGFRCFDEGDSPEVNLLGYSTEQDGDYCRKGLALVTHLDTVPAGDCSLWTETHGDPWGASLQGDKIFGLGSADTKLDFLCKLQAIEQVGLKNIKIPLALIGTYGEERALAGARELMAKKIISPKFALVGEPSELRPVLGHKGILYMRAMFPHPNPLPQWERETAKIFHGKAAHGSMPHLGLNAIYQAIDWLEEERKTKPHLQILRIHGGNVHNIVPQKCEVEVAEGNHPCPRIEFLVQFLRSIRHSEEKFKLTINRRFDPPITTYNVGVVRTHERGLELEFDYRLIPETGLDLLRDHWKELPQCCPGAVIEEIRSNEPMATAEGSELAARVTSALQEISLPATFLYKSGNTEGAIFNQMGAESIVIGPGTSIGNIHQPNEFNTLSQLQMAVQFYTAFLHQFC